MDAVAGALALGFGPLLVGMPLEQVPTAVPGAQWITESTQRFSGAWRQVRTEHGVRIAEVDFSARLARGHHGQYSIGLEHVGAAADADDCERRARAVFLTIEPQTGPMTSPGELIANEYIEEIGARSQVKLSQTLDDAMRKPTTRAKLKGRQPAHRWLRATSPRDGAQPDIEMRFAMDYSRQAGSAACIIRLEAERPGRSPEPERVAFTALTADRVPPLSLRHLLASRLLATGHLPPGGVELLLACRVARGDGGVGRCEASGMPAIAATEDERPRQLAQLRAARQLAETYHFDLAKLPGLDRDDPVALQVEIPVRIHPEDVRTLPNTESAAPITAAGFRWTKAASAATLERLYPTRALRAGEESAVSLVCRVEEDYSMVCAPIQQDPRPAPDFEWAALEILTYYRAEPTATDGTSTVGRRVLQRLQFRME